MAKAYHGGALVDPTLFGPISVRQSALMKWTLHHPPQCWKLSKTRGTAHQPPVRLRVMDTCCCWRWLGGAEGGANLRLRPAF